MLMFDVCAACYAPQPKQHPTCVSATECLKSPQHKCYCMLLQPSCMHTQATQASTPSGVAVAPEPPNRTAPPTHASGLHFGSYTSGTSPVWEAHDRLIGQKNRNKAHLVCPADQVQVVPLQEVSHAVWAKRVAHAAVVLAPALINAGSNTTATEAWAKHSQPTGCAVSASSQ
jgi:hypothetical protein